MIGLVLMAALLAWKGAMYPETAQLRQFLGMQATVTADLWWTGAGCAIALALMIYISVRLRKRRAVHSRDQP